MYKVVGVWGNTEFRLGVLRDVCTEKDWDDIYAEHARKKAEAEAAAAA